MDESVSPILVSEAPTSSRAERLGMALVFLGVVAALVAGYLQFRVLAASGFTGPPADAPHAPGAVAGWILSCTLLGGGLASAVWAWLQPRQGSGLVFVTACMGVPAFAVALVFTWMFVFAR